MQIYNINCKVVDIDIPISDDLKKLVESIKLDKNFTSYRNDSKRNELIDFICNNYKKNLLDAVAVFTDIKKLDSFKMSHCWVQKYVNKKHCMHVHGEDNSKLSFVWYVNTSEKSSPITFYNPGFPYSDFWVKEIYPKNNKFLIFNSYIPHEVAYNTDSGRMAISGNIDLKWQK